MQMRSTVLPYQDPFQVFSALKIKTRNPVLANKARVLGSCRISSHSLPLPPAAMESFHSLHEPSVPPCWKPGAAPTPPQPTPVPICRSNSFQVTALIWTNRFIPARAVSIILLKCIKQPRDSLSPAVSGIDLHAG